MSDPFGMSGNIHTAGSQMFAGWARNGRKPTDSDLTPEGDAFREYALIQATQAVAYEQRTANLIAAWGTEALLNSTQVAEQQLAIRARLGITERTTP